MRLRTLGPNSDLPRYTRVMGKLIVEQVVTADAFGASKDGSIDWFEQDPSLTEMDHDQLDMLRGVDAMLLGATTYKMFLEFWPTSKSKDAPVAEFINTKPKHVFSSSLESAPWGSYAPAIVEHGDLAKTVATLRARYQGNLILWGSLKLAESMFRAKLVDELRLRSCPVLIGEGRPIAPSGLVKLELAETKAYPKGHVLTAYRVDRT